MTAERTRLEIAGFYFKDLSGIRLEWSLKIDEATVKPRNQLSFFMGKENANNRLPFYKLSCLLEQLNCPDEVVEFQKKTSCFSLTQGIRFSLSDVYHEHCIYLHYKDIASQQVKRDAYRWNDLGLIAHTFYKFYLFSDLPKNRSPLNYAHPQYRHVLEHLLKNDRLQWESGFLLQYQGHRVMEIYITYHWHPVVETILGSHLDLGTENNGIAQYKSLNFRHIGFSSFEVENPSMTLYFSAPLQGKWPDNLQQAQEEVRLSGQALHELLKHI